MSGVLLHGVVDNRLKVTSHFWSRLPYIKGQKDASQPRLSHYLMRWWNEMNEMDVEKWWNENTYPDPVSSITKATWSDREANLGSQRRCGKRASNRLRHGAAQ